MNTKNTQLGGRYIPGNAIPIEQALTELAALIKRVRIEKNATQKELSIHCNVSLAVVRRVETGKPISSENLFKIMRALSLLGLFFEAFKEPELSPQDRWELNQKKEKAKKQRVRHASRSDT